MVCRAPVAETADINGGLVLFGDIGGTRFDLGALGGDEADERLCLLALCKDRAEETDAFVESLVKHAVRAGHQRYDRHAELFLQGVRLVGVAVEGDDDIRLAGEDLLRLGALGIRPADAAGGQRREHVAVGEHIGPRDGIEHLRALGERFVVDILHAAEQGYVADVAVEPQRARADAHDALIRARRHGDLPTDEVGNGDLRALGGRFRRFGRCFRGRRGLGRGRAARGKRKKHCKREQQRKELSFLHSIFLPKLLSFRLR